MGLIPADQIPLIVQDRTFVPDAASAWLLQDPTWDTTRWGTKGSFWYHHVYMPAQNPGDPSGMSAYGRWMYGPWFWPPAADTVYGPIDNPYYDGNCNLDDPATWQYQTDPFCEPKQIPGTPNISVGMEQFNDTPIVNGVAYPKVNSGTEDLPLAHAECCQRPLLQLPMVRSRPNPGQRLDRGRPQGFRTRGRSDRPESSSQPRTPPSACQVPTGSRSVPRVASCRLQSLWTASSQPPGSQTQLVSMSAMWISTRCC